MANKKVKDNKVITDINKEVEFLKSCLDKLSDDINVLQNGDGKNPYWNGESAVEMVKNISKYIDVNYSIVDGIMNCKEI